MDRLAMPFVLISKVTPSYVVRVYAYPIDLAIQDNRTHTADAPNPDVAASIKPTLVDDNIASLPSEFL